MESLRKPLDDLLSPSLHADPPPATYTKRPWLLSSQLYVAFLGGIPALVVIAWRNAARLRAPGIAGRILGVGILVFLVVLFATAYLSTVVTGAQALFLKHAHRALALALFLVYHRWQRTPDRLYRIARGDAYASLWVPGLAAVIVLGAVHLVLLALVQSLWT
jgi:hypothetical protein